MGPIGMRLYGAGIDPMYEAFKATPGKTNPKILQAINTNTGLRGAQSPSKGQHPVGAQRVSLPQGMAGFLWPSGMVDLLYLWPSGQCLANLEGRLSRLLHTQRQGTHPSQGQPTVIRADGKTDGIVRIMQSLHMRFMARHHGPQHQIRVAPHISSPGDD